MIQNPQINTRLFHMDHGIVRWRYKITRERRHGRCLRKREAIISIYKWERGIKED